MKELVLVVALTLLLGSCTAGQIYRTAAEVGDAGEAYVEEKIIVRQEYRARQRDIVDAEYKAEMRAADAAERNGDIEKAKIHWEAAWNVLETHMPSLKFIKKKIYNFFSSEVE